MKNRLHLILLFALAILSTPVLAEDIDLFVSASPANTGIPNVLIVFDNAASFSANNGTGYTCTMDGTSSNLGTTVGAIEQCAFYEVVKSLTQNDDGSGKVNVGMMAYNSSRIRDWTDANNTCGDISDDGGCLMVPLMEMTSTNQTNLLNWIKTWKTSGSAGPDYVKASTSLTAGVMQEAWAYYSGNTGLSGYDYSGIQPTSGCHSNYVVFIGNSWNNSGKPGDGGNTSPKNALSNAPNVTSAYTTIMNPTFTSQACGTTTLGSNSHENRGYYADEWAKYMHNVDFDTSFTDDQVITTYTIGLLNAGSCKPEYPALLDNMADEGGGLYYATSDYDTLKTALTNVFSEIQSVNSVFASVSLPVSVNTQGTYLNQVFVGLFRPDGSAAPRWDGNLKQYKLGYINGALKLQDADSAAAINANTGFISECARSFWTPLKTDAGQPDDYWDGVNGYDDGTCLTATGYEKSNTPDGNLVERGATGYVLRTQDPDNRTVLTCSTTFASCDDVDPVTFNTTNVSTSDLNTPATNWSDKDDAGNKPSHAEAVDWIRGKDIKDEDGDGVTDEMRPSAHGDVVHSRPVAVNHGTNTDEVVVYYGANDGMLHAINGNRSTSLTYNSTTYAPGEELWAFAPPEFFSSFQRLYDNSPQISYYGNPTTSPAPEPKPYAIDGSITAHQFWDSGDVTFIFATMRRGGRVIYAFDVSDPGDPHIEWKIGCPNNFASDGSVSDSNCTSDYSDMGQTWSTPKPFNILSNANNSGQSNNNKKYDPLLFVGGGYDVCEDYDAMAEGDANSGGANHDCDSSVKGDKIYVIDAKDGDREASFDTKRSVVGDVFVVPDSLNTAVAAFAYAIDIEGNVYRISAEDNNGNPAKFGSTTPNNWIKERIADLGCDTVFSCTANRKFMFGPDVVQAPDHTDANPSYILLFGSGDREKPLEDFGSSAAVTNYFFAIKDKPLEHSSWYATETTNCSNKDRICLNSLLNITSSTPSAADLATKPKGWYLSLSSKEQTVTSAITVFDTITFSTHTPHQAAVNSCGSDLGTSKVYNINYEDASGENGVRSEEISGGGLPPSPIAGKVTLDDGTTVPFVIGGSNKSPIEAKQPTSSGGGDQSKGRMYWYIEK